MRKGRPVDADSAATRKAIVEAATAAFAQDGYHGTVLASIAQAAGITAPTLYHYFSSKAELFQIVGDEFTAEFWRRSEAAMADIESPTLRIAAMLRALGDWIVERPETAAFVATYASEVARNADVWRLSPAERWTEPMARFSEMAADGIERGEIAADLDEATVAGLIQGLIYGMSALVGVGRTFGPPDQVIEAFARMIEGTVFLEATPSSARQRRNAEK